MEDVTTLAAKDCALAAARHSAAPARGRQYENEPTENAVEIPSPSAEDLCAEQQCDSQTLADEHVDASSSSSANAVAGESQAEESDAAPDAECTAHDAGEIAARIEALIFACDAPLSAKRIADLLQDVKPSQVREYVKTLNAKYEQAGLTFRIEAIARGYQMMSLPEYRPWISRMHTQRDDTRLSPAALETLSIIAYKQPVIRADIDAIRGVNSGEVIHRLRELGLVRVVGRAEIVGRPLLYGTTRKFLDTFGLADLDDLPPLEALTITQPQSKPREQVEPVTPPIAAAGA